MILPGYPYLEFGPLILRVTAVSVKRSRARCRYTTL